MAVIAKAKDPAGYVFGATRKSPKALRLSFVPRMQDLILDVAEQLYRANEVFAARAHRRPTNKNRDIRPQGAVKIANMAEKRTVPHLCGCRYGTFVEYLTPIC